MLRILKIQDYIPLKHLNFLSNKKYFCSMMHNFNIYESSKKLNIEKTEYFLKLDPKCLSSYGFQRDRFHFDEQGKLMLFNNQMRKESILKIINSTDKKIFITGPRGVGKSHLLALLVLYLRKKIEINNNLNQKHNCKVFYINNPKQYYIDPIQCFIDDLIYFAGDEIKANEKILKVFLKIKNLKRAEEALEIVLNYLDKHNLKYFLVLDQYNIINNYSTKAKITSFLEDLESRFSNVIKSAYNTNKTINDIKDSGKEIIMSKSNIFANDNEKKNYLEELNYFGKIKISDDFCNYISEITNFVPLEIYKFSKYYIEACVLHKNETEENIIKKATETYFKFRFIEIGTSHSNFIREYFKDSDHLVIFIDLLGKMDKYQNIQNLIEYNNFIDYNCMEVDLNNRWIASVCPAAKRFLDEKYNIKFIGNLEPMQKNKVIENLFLDVRHNNDGDSYEILVKNWFAKADTKIIKFSKTIKELIIPSSFNLFWVSNLNIDFTAQRENVGDYIFNIQDRQFDIIDMVYFKNSASKHKI